MSPIEPVECWVGRRVGSYILISVIDTNAASSTYLGRHEQLDVTVVVTWMHDRAFSSTGNRSEELDEQTTRLRSLKTTSFARRLDVLDVEGFAFIVMENIEGKSLGERLRSRTLSPRQVLAYAAEIATALHDARAAGLCTPSLRLDDVRIDSGGRVKLPCPTIGRATHADLLETLAGILEELSAQCPEVPTDANSPSSRLQEMRERRRSRAAPQRPPRQLSRATSWLARRAIDVLALYGILSLLQSTSHEFDDWPNPYTVVRSRAGPGCAADDSGQLHASAHMPTPESGILRFHIHQEDQAPWTTSGTLRLYVGEGPTCTAKPHNVIKNAISIVEGRTLQIIDLDVNSYDGAWSVGEKKTFWIGQSNHGWDAYRGSNLVQIERIAQAPR
ncbi:hypothetical protein [Chondromyces crocatus]|uniref:Protein kinase domain-containing protein n=1 Tax=Chondromyces crocatus TaxID=52 RepID=A0A0K1EK71_CHOCO|nr:hypothetical protein [Chondromyces crocatus]AKT41259.1 uncharacterized protein CMC5_054260 [Chondromyces crocatus]